jgi:hypothetical protein
MEEEDVLDAKTMERTTILKDDLFVGVGRVIRKKTVSGKVGQPQQDNHPCLGPLCYCPYLPEG